MPEKIYDIFPPKAIKKEKFPLKGERKVKKKSRRISYLIFLIFLFLIFFSSSFLFAFVKIDIYPKFKIENFETEVIVKEGVKEIDFEKGIIPGFYLSKESTLFEEFSSTGKTIKEGKAKGVIRVFNEYSTTPQAFRAGTRFMSANGKVFITPKRIVIPGKKLEKGKWIPGFKDIEVEAIEAGEDYNIEPTTFSIPGLSGTSLYTFFYGKSFQKMTGGYRKEISKVTKEDLEKAKEILLEKIKQNQLNSLLEKGKELGAIFLSKTLKQEVIASEPLAKEGDEIEKFGYKIKMRSEALFCKEKFLKEFAKKYAELITPKEKILSHKSLKLNFKIKSVDLEKGEARLALNFSFKIFDQIDLDQVKEELRGKKKKEVIGILKRKEKISKSEIKISPFWVKTLPKNKERIKINLIVD